ncbi:hypothetical protein JOC70_003232 [Clostridium pascui]|nr:hypothetical protein [Clostridium pascui]MBM7871722.1 hypothetical protein [Clostridium pascui]
MDVKINSIGFHYIELSKYTSQKENIEKELERLLEEWIKYNED